MSRVLSIDLAYKAVRDFGICALEEDQGLITSTKFIEANQLCLSDPPEPAIIATNMFKFCSDEDIRILLLDGPQGWKDPGSKLVHSRHCERILNTPAKTGVVGQVKPAAYTAFVKFSIAVFAKLTQIGAELAFSAAIEPIENRLLVLESFPLSAWRKLGITPLPSKAKATRADCDQRFNILTERFGLRCEFCDSHDALQALVAGLAGVAVAGRKSHNYIAEGVTPFFQDGDWLEGYIVNPLCRPLPQ